MQMKEKLDDGNKASIVQLAESYRRDGYRHYVAKTAETLKIKPGVVSGLLKKYRDGKLTITSNEITSFSNNEWSVAKSEVAYIGTAATRKIAVRLHEELDKEEYNSKSIRDLASAYASIMRENRDLMGDVSFQKGGHGNQVQTNIQIALPPKQDMPIEGGIITVKDEVVEEVKKKIDN